MTTMNRREPDEASGILKSLYSDLKKEQLRKTIMQLALEINNENYLRSITAYMATLADKKEVLHYGR